MDLSYPMHSLKKKKILHGMGGNETKRNVLHTITDESAYAKEMELGSIWHGGVAYRHTNQPACLPATSRQTNILRACDGGEISGQASNQASDRCIHTGEFFWEGSTDH
jgi:hypothetical protein